MRRLPVLPLVLAIGLLAVPQSYAARDRLAFCAAIQDREERLDCFDDYARTVAAGGDRVAAAKAPDIAAHAPAPTRIEAAGSPGPEPEPWYTYLERMWNLSKPEPQSITVLEPHRLTYLLFGRWSDNVNQLPGSPSQPAGSVPLGIQANDLKFQFSAKAELIGPVFQTRLWFGYTQQSHWQVYDGSKSRPFRETNYEPEFILSHATDNQDSGLKLVNLGIVHQSNGQSDPLSRSWNRVYLQGGWEWDKWSVLARGWHSFQTEDNPDINDYVGRGEIVARWGGTGAHSGMVSLLLRNNLRTSPNRGFAQVDWRAFTFNGVGLHLQATSGFGESLIDYNHRQKTFGIGISFAEWERSSK